MTSATALMVVSPICHGQNRALCIFGRQQKILFDTTAASINFCLNINTTHKLYIEIRVPRGPLRTLCDVAGCCKLPLGQVSQMVVSCSVPSYFIKLVSRNNKASLSSETWINWRLQVALDRTQQHAKLTLKDSIASL